MHDLLVGNVINYSLVGLPERKARYTCTNDINIINKVTIIYTTLNHEAVFIPASKDSCEDAFFAGEKLEIKRIINKKYLGIHKNSCADKAFISIGRFRSFQKVVDRCC